jgi:small subunit ribosomal protein S4
MKTKRFYGVLEAQFRRYVDIAGRSKGNTGEALLRLMETRLDNAVLRLGFGVSRAQSRQLIRHGHVLVNGRRVNIPSFSVSAGDVISPVPSESAKRLVAWGLEESRGKVVPAWLDRADGDQPKGTVVRMPARDEISAEVNEQLVVEFCSR